jgi:serine O-acetyltransferase
MDAALVGGVHVMSTGTNGSREEPGVPPLREAIWEDLTQMAKAKGCRFPSVGGMIDVLSIPGTWAVILFRLASTAHHKGIRPLSRLIFFMNVVLFGAELAPGAIIQPGLVIPHPVGICWGGDCRVGRRARLLHHTGMGSAGNPKFPGMPVFGDDVTLLEGSLVFGPVHIGDRSILAARAVVVQDVPPDTYVYGVRKSETMRPLAEMGLGEQEEAKLGYGAAARRAKLLADTPNESASNGHSAHAS